MVCIGVIGAMEEEVASLINQMEDAESTWQSVHRFL